MKRFYSIVLCMVLCAMLLITPAACSASPVNNDESYVPTEADTYNADAAYEESTYDSAAAESSTAEESGLGDLPNVHIPDTNHKLIYSASFDIQTKQYDSDYRAIKNALSSVDGYVEQENTWSDGNEYGAARYSNLSLRVPIGNYNAFLDTVSGIGTATDKQLSTQDASDQYYDTEARIEILEQRQARLMGYLKTTTDTEDIIALEAELSDVLYELDQLKGSQRSIDKLVDYAQVNINLNEVLSAETIMPDGEPLGARAANAYQMSMTGVGQFLQGFAIFMAAAAPVLILLGVIAVIVIVIVKLIQFWMRKWRSAHPAKIAPKKPDVPPAPKK